jgi:hypothetical protein
MNGVPPTSADASVRAKPAADVVANSLRPGTGRGTRGLTGTAARKYAESIQRYTSRRPVNYMGAFVSRVFQHNLGGNQDACCARFACDRVFCVQMSMTAASSGSMPEPRWLSASPVGGEMTTIG